jgi:hypothetical protein
LGADLVSNRAYLGFRSRDDDYPGSLTGAGQGDRTPDALAGAGDNDRLPAELLVVWHCLSLQGIGRLLLRDDIHFSQENVRQSKVVVDPLLFVANRGDVLE